MSTPKLQRLRQQAFIRQGCRCYYCRYLIWEAHPDQFAQSFGLTLSTARFFQSTAEHLTAKQDEGKDAYDNVVAACLVCNRRRHEGRSKSAPDPKRYRSQVTRLVALEEWHPESAHPLRQP